MSYPFKSSLAIAILATVVSGQVIAQTRPTMPVLPGSIPALPGSFGATAPKTGPKPYKEVITDKAKSQKGLFTVHKVEDKFYFEIPDSMMGREFMAITRLSKVPTGAGFGGEIANQQTLAFEKGPSNNVFLRTITLVNTADSGSMIYKAVTNSNVNAITAAFPIAAFGKDSTTTIIEVTDFFKGDNQVVSLSANTKRRYNFSGLATDRSYIVKMSTYPINTEVRTVKTFFASPGGGLSVSPFPSSSLPAASDAGAVTLEMNTSMILLPKTPMQARYWDTRVGFFPENFVEYTDDQQRVEDKTFAVRWRLEPKPGDEEKWKRGELVEPKKPIVYYIDPATPKQWRKYLIAGVNDWQKAFEKAGFKNAIHAEEWPESDSTMSMEDARFSVLRYFASDIANAYGPNVHDPRSGEVLESHIGWYHNVMKLVHDWYMIQTAAVDPGARKMKYDDELMGDLIRFVSSHEVGHTLGLLHNMGNSSRTPVEKLRDKAWVEANGHTASIMDYARFNYVAQPEDNITRKGLYPRIGDYDYWAMRWGYGYIPGNTEAEIKKNSNKLIIESIQANPRLYFGTYELGNRIDPRAQSEDLGDNAMKASEYGIKNLQRILPNLAAWTKEDGVITSNLSEIYMQLIGQFSRYMGHVSRNIGGVYETFKADDQQGAVYEITPKATQKEALAFLQKQLFETPKWLIDKSIWDRVSNATGSADPVASVQESAMNNLISGERLNRMQQCVDRFGADKAYNAIEFLGDVEKGLYSELATKKPIDTYRRTIQKNYAERLISLTSTATPAATVVQGFSITFGPNLKNSDVPSIAKAQLIGLQAKIKAALPTITDQMSRIHLNDILDRIKQALDPK